VVGNGDGSSGTLTLADGPELLEGSSANDGWLVGAGAHQDVVGSTVRCHGALSGGSTGWVVGTEVLNNVVLDQRILGPTINGEVAVSVRVVGAGVLNDSEPLINNHINHSIRGTSYLF